MRVARVTWVLALMLTWVWAANAVAADDPEPKVKSNQVSVGLSYQSKDTNTIGQHITSLVDGGYLVAGKKEVKGNRVDAHLVKFGKDGKVEWEKTYGTSENDEAIFATEVREAGLLKGYALFGNTSGNGTNPFGWYRFIKETGEEDEDNRVEYGDHGYDALQIISVNEPKLKDSQFLLAGSAVRKKNDSKRAWIARVDAKGKIIKEQTVGYEKSEGWNMEARFLGTGKEEDRFYVVANSFSEDGKADFWIIATDKERLKNSDTASVRLGDGKRFVTAATQLSTGEIVMAVAEGYKEAKANQYLYRFNETTDVEKQPIATDDNSKTIYTLKEAANGEILMGGTSMPKDQTATQAHVSTSIDEGGKLLAGRFWIARATKTLKLKWQRVLPALPETGAPSDYPHGAALSLLENDDKTLVVVGAQREDKSVKTDRYPFSQIMSSNPSTYVIRTSRDGNVK